MFLHFLYITGPPTHSVGAVLFCSLACVVVCRLSTSVTLHGRPTGGFTRACQAMTSCRLQCNYSSTVTLHGGPVVLRPVRVTPCLQHFLRINIVQTFPARVHVAYSFGRKSKRCYARFLEISRKWSRRRKSPNFTRFCAGWRYHNILSFRNEKGCRPCKSTNIIVNRPLNLAFHVVNVVNEPQTRFGSFTCIENCWEGGSRAGAARPFRTPLTLGRVALLCYYLSGRAI